MALSDPSIQGIERLESKSSKKLPIPLDVCIAGRNLKITDYNELFDLNKINGDSRRITTLTIKTVSTYKQKLESASAASTEPAVRTQSSGDQQVCRDSVVCNRESNKNLRTNRETPFTLANNINKSTDKENRQVSSELGDKPIIESTKSANLVNRKANDLEQRKIKQITIQKSIQVDPNSRPSANDDQQLNSRTYSSKANEDTFIRNSKRSSSLRQINLFTKYGNTDLRPTDKFDNRSAMSQTSEQSKSASGEQKGKFFYFNGTNDEMMYKDEIDKLSSNQKQSTITGATSGVDDKFKKHLNASLNSSFNSNYNNQSKDGNNNSSLKAANPLINSRLNAGLSSKQQYAQSSPPSFQMNNSLTNSTIHHFNQQPTTKATKQSNQFTNQGNYLEQYQQANQQVNNSFVRKKQSSIRKLSAGGNADEINCDEFVSELKTKIANNNQQTTSSPATAAKLAFNSNSLSKQERSRHLILDTSTLPHLSRSKEATNLVNNFETNQQIRPLLTSSIRRNESFQKATEHRIRMEPVRRSSRSSKDAVQSTRQQSNVDASDKLDSQMNSRNTHRFSYLGSQAVNGFQTDNRQSNENLANDTGTTTDDWNTTLDTNADTKSSLDERSKQFKKCDKYGFFINEDDKQNSNRTRSIRKNEQIKKTNLEIDRRREMKWLEMLNNWDRYMQKRWNKICERCRKGIPPSLRGRAWFHLCAAHKQKHHKPDLFYLLNQQPGNESINDEIIKDLHRQFPNHEMFAGTNTEGQQDLFTILKNFSIIKPDIQYCQGEAPIASVLLMHLPVEDAFFALLQLCDHYLSGYFSVGLETIQMHGRMLNSLLKRHNNYVYKVLKKQKIDSTMYMTEWFMCVFSRTLPWPTVLRIWDMFFCEGIKIVFRVALVILNSIEPELRRAKCLSNDKLIETMEVLKHLPKKYLEVEYLVPRVIEMNLSEKDLEIEHFNILKKTKKKK